MPKEKETIAPLLERPKDIIERLDAQITMMEADLKKYRRLRELVAANAEIKTLLTDLQANPP